MIQPLFSLRVMAPRGRKIPILKPSWIKPGYYFRSCRGYRSAAAIRYDYKLYNRFGKELKLQPQGWRRTLSFNFPISGAGGKQRRLDIHRLFAFNETGRCNCNRHRWGSGAHVHHHPRPRRCPWKDCRAKNMIVPLATDHAEWHRRHPDVPDCTAMRL